MAFSHTRLRRQHPYLTPGIFPDDEDGQRDLLNRFKLPRIPIPVEDEAEAAPISRRPQPEFGEPYGSVPALRRPLADIDRIANLGEASPLPLPESDVPLLSREPMLNRRVRPTVALDDEGHPGVVFGGDDPEQRVIARRRAIEEYQPQKESKKSLVLRTLLGQLRGGLIGQGGSLDTLLGNNGMFDRRGKDEDWQQRELGQVDATLARRRADQRTELQDDYLRSQTEENRAQTAKALREPIAPPVKPPALARRIPPVKQVDEAGNEYLADAETGEPLLDAKGNPRYTSRAKAAPPVKPDPNVGKYEAAKGLMDDLSAQEEAARVAKDAAWAEYQTAKARYPKDADIQADVIAAKAAVDDAEKYYKSFWGKKNEAKAEMKKYEPRAAPAVRSEGLNRKGKSMSRASLPEAAKRMGLSVAEAEAQLKREGVSFH